MSVPKPLLVAAEKDWTAVKWGGFSLVLALVWMLYIRLGFGDLDSALALGGIPQLLGHVLFGALLSYSALRGYAYSWESSRRPYGTGLFLFPSGIVQARGSELIEHDAAGLLPRREGSALLLQAGRQTFRFEAASSELAEQAMSHFEEGAEQWKALPPEEALERARLCPLVESGVPNPLAPTDPHPRPRLLGPTLLVVVSGVLALSLGYSVHYFRTQLSEEALYQSAVGQNTVDSLKAYIARGGKRNEVESLLLPRAELELARSKKSVAAILEFRESHRGSQIEGDIQGALREALLADLELARKKGTLTALDELSRRHKDSGLIAGEIAHARRAVIEQAFAKFQKVINPETEGLLTFIRRLLAYAEQHGPTVKLRTVQEFSQDPKEIDGLVMKSKKYFLGQKQLPTQYFLGDSMRAREKAMLEAIRDRLQKAVQPDVLKFELGEIPGEANAKLPEPNVPTLTIVHKERLSGGFVGGKPRGMYMGAAVYMNSSFDIPGQGDPLLQKLTQWRPPRFGNPGEDPPSIPEVYETMIGGAFDKYQEKYVQFWFK